MTYQEMLKELEQCVQTVSDRDVDLDRMVSSVARGYELIQQMRKQLQESKMAIETLQTQFQESPE